MPIPQSLTKLSVSIPLTYDTTPDTLGSDVENSVCINEYGPFPQYQILSMWCWNAAGAAVSSYFLKADVEQSEIQCNNATKYLSGASKCCEITIPSHEGTINGWVPTFYTTTAPIHHDIGNVPCNQGGVPQTVIDGTGKLTTNQVTYSGTSGPNSTDVTAVVDALKEKRPVVMRIRWNAGGGHSVVIYGSYTKGGDRFYNIADPWSGYEISNGSPTGGHWKHSVFTKAK